MIVTLAILNKISPAIVGVRGELIAKSLTDICPKYGIDQPTIFHEFIANLLVECREFTRFRENLNYSPKRLMQVWPGRFPDLTTARQFAYNPVKLANYVYGGRRDLGNSSPGDGAMFIGSGPIQITGKANITAFTNYYNAKFNANYTPADMAQLLRDNSQIAICIHSACWFFAIYKKLISYALNNDLKAIIKRITGAYTGSSSRVRFYNRAKIAIP